MSDAPVVFHGVSKKFRRGELHDSLRDLIPNLTRRLLSRPPATGLNTGDFWALRNVSFDVQPGEALGIIGPNGAGKSTVLKLLCRILRPTEGYCAVRGRVGALIEVAAGFHPDLTGRENIYLQGAIMGMDKEQVRRRFDEIVEFSGIADFISTPVKRYSSGMNARLGFSIAAHLEPDVLIVDEVLAVGDFTFQSKAFARIKEVAQSGIPVVVVSHQLDRIATLSTRAILLNKGEVAFDGKPRECIAAYIQQAAEGTAPEVDTRLRIDSLTVTPRNPRSGEMAVVRIGAEVTDIGQHEEYAIGIRIRQAETGQIVFGTNTSRCGVDLPEGRPFEIDVRLDFNLAPGIYSVETFIRDRRREVRLADGPATFIEVKESASFFGLVHMNPQMSLSAHEHTVSVAATS